MALHGKICLYLLVISCAFSFPVHFEKLDNRILGNTVLNDLTKETNNRVKKNLGDDIKASENAKPFQGDDMVTRNEKIPGYLKDLVIQKSMDDVKHSGIWRDLTDATITASSSWSSSYMPDNLKIPQGNPWHGKGHGKDQWLLFEFPKPVTIDKFRTKAHKGWDGSAFKDYVFQVSNDGHTWKTLKSGQGINQDCCTWQVIDFPATESKMFRLFMSTNWGYGWLSIAYLEFHFLHRSGQQMSHKDTKNIKDALIKHRNYQAQERAADVDAREIRNPDIEDDKYLGLYSKGMVHDANGVATEAAIKELQLALETGRQSDFDDIKLGGARKLTNPQAALAFEYSGQDPEGTTIPASPALASREAAGEMVEVFEKNILRDKTFSEINGGGADIDLDRAIKSLNSFGTDFKGLKDGGVVTRKTLFRGVSPGEQFGPYVSQFLQHPFNFGAQKIEQKYMQDAGQYGITEADFLAIQNGNVPTKQVKGALRFVSTPRDLGSVVHIDFLYQQPLYGLLILLSAGATIRDAFPSNPSEGQFVTGGGVVEMGTALAEVSRHAFKAAWVQKWRKNLRLRPETMAGRLVKQMEGALPAGTVHGDLVTSPTVAAVSAYNSAKGGENKPWLPLQYAEGSPTHPSYPAGHATVAGACVTILKIYFKEAAWSTTGLDVLESRNGISQSVYAGAGAADMTIHGELNKLASNIAIGRNMAGVHYRSDGDRGKILGEKVAIQYFKDLKAGIAEEVQDITLVKFDGTSEKI